MPGHKKKIAIGAVFAIILIGLFFYFENNIQNDPLNASYLIEDRLVSLKSGFSEEEIVPDSASKQITSVLWSPVKGDLNSDKKDDYAMIVTQNSGGSGTFYYVVAGLSSKKGIIGTNGVFLGDRISPESIFIENGKILINYSEREDGEPMAAQPTVKVSKSLIVKDGRLLEE